MTIDAEQTSGLIVIGGLVVVLAMQIRHGVWLREIARHDGVLFRFCEIRRSVVRLLFDRHLDGELSRRDYVDARRLLDVLNHVIGDYDKRKAVMFNFRRFVRALRKYEKTAGELRLPSPPQDAQIAEFYRQTDIAVLRGFLAYTPLIRSELWLQFFRLFLSARWRRALPTGVDRFRRDAERLGVRISIWNPQISATA